MARRSPLLLHVSALLFMGYGIQSLFDGTVPKYLLSIDKDQVGGQYQAFTVLGVVIACISTFLSVMCDLDSSSIAYRTLKRSITVVALPTTIIIATIYWTLLLGFPSLILPTLPAASSKAARLLVTRIPMTANLALNAAPAASLLLDFYMFERKYSDVEAYSFAPATAFTHTIGHAMWIEYCAVAHPFPYPFLTGTLFTTRLWIYAGTLGVTIISFWGLNRVHP